MYAYNKNFQDLGTQPDEKQNDETESVGRYKVFTFDYMVKHLIDYGEEQSEARIRQVAHWKLRTTENILRSLIKHHMDIIAK